MASAILGVSLAVMLTNMGTMVVGARVADRRTVEERLVRNQIERLMAMPLGPAICSPSAVPPSTTVDGTNYTISIAVNNECPVSDYAQYRVTATDPSGATVSLSVGRFKP